MRTFKGGTEMTIKLKLLRGKLSPDMVRQHAPWRQVTRDAGMRGELYIPESSYDLALSAAGKLGVSLER